MAKAKPAKSLRVGFLIDDSLDRPDGVQQWVLAAGRYLTKAGHQVVYFAGQTERTDLPGLVSLGRLQSWRFNKNRGQSPGWVSGRKLRAAWQQNPVDIVHVQAPYSPFLAHRFIGQLAPEVPVMASFHVLPANRLAATGIKALGWLVRSSRQRVALFSSNSEATRDFYRQAWGVNSSMVYNPVDIDRFGRARPLSLGPNPGGPIQIVFLGRLVDRKGPGILLEAVGRLPESVKVKISLHIGGRGPLESKLRQQATGLGLAGITKFWGFIDEADKASFLAAADIIVLPATAGESFGISLVEALAGGRSLVLAGDNPGYRSILNDQPKLLFDTTRPDQLADLLVEFLAQPRAGWQPFIDWGLEKVQNYDIKRTIGPQLEDLYWRLIKQPPKN